MVRRAVLAATFVVAITAPAGAQLTPGWLVDSPTADAHATAANTTQQTQLAKQIKELQAQLQLVQSAQTELRALPASFKGADIQGALSNVTGLLQTAQQECVLAQSANPNGSAAWQASENAAKQSWLSGSGAATPVPAAPLTQTKAPASQCQISSAAANLQAAQLGTSAAEIQSIQNAGAGSSGSLQALQAAVAGISKLAAQNDQVTQRYIATQQQEQYNQKTLLQVSPSNTGNPW
jgi:hypothetical protein